METYEALWTDNGNWLPSGIQRFAMKAMAHLYMIYPLNIVIFHLQSQPTGIKHPTKCVNPVHA